MDKFLPKDYIAGMNKADLTILLATPRGFCAGVDRAIQIVERSLEKYGAPVYVRHEIVHNRYVVCLLYTSPSPRDRQKSRMPSSA